MYYNLKIEFSQRSKPLNLVKNNNVTVTLGLVILSESNILYELKYKHEQ